MSRLLRRPRLALLLALLILPLSAAFAAPRVGALRCESRIDPLGVDTATPRLSWQMIDPIRNARQTAYQILVASSLERLARNEGDRWDSGQVASDESNLVPYGGQPLHAHDACFWKVRLWDGNNAPSPWSTPARWSMGLGRAADWPAQWIGLEAEERSAQLTDTSWIAHPDAAQPAGPTWYRREFTLPADRPITRAVWQYTGDSEARGWVNDLDLGARDNPNRVKWNDLTNRLEPGRTYVLGLMGTSKAGSPRPAAVTARLEIEFAVGPPLVIRTDETWRATRQSPANWNQPGADAATWSAVRIVAPAGDAPWGAIAAGEDRRRPALWLRKEFTLDRAIRRATLSVCGLGTSEVYLNGEKVGDHVLSPALSQYDHRAYYVTHDVTTQVRPGANALGVVLGGGRFYSDRSKVYAGTVNAGWPKLLLLLRLEHADGTVSEIPSDPTWRLTSEGPIRAAGEFDGEDYDARRTLGRWSEAGYQETVPWQPAHAVPAPSPALEAQRQEPIRVTATLRPVAMTEPRPGVFIFDLGQNLVGWCRLRVRGPAGTRIRLRHAETLRPDGSLYLDNLRGAQATDHYTLSGMGDEAYEPRFTYHGFRFVEMTGFPGRPTLDTIAGRVVHDDLPIAGTFTSSHPLLNRIYQNVTWGTRGNYRSIPTDCPQRDERQAWLGDRSEVSRGETYLFQALPFYAKWLQDIADTQRENGSVPDVAPAYWPTYTDNVTWPSTYVIIPGMLHRQYGDLAPIRTHYAALRRWAALMRTHVQDGIINRDTYGDWCVPPEDLRRVHSEDPARRTEPALLATAFFYHDLRRLERYATLLDHPAEAAEYARWADEMKTAFNQRFLHRDRGWYDNGTQTACVLPLAFGLVPAAFRDRVFARLVDRIEHDTHGHLGTGLIGGQHLLRVLSDHGRADLAGRIATQATYPGWGYMVNQGATTVWELWNGNTADPSMNSGNHVMLVGDLVIWLHEYLAGIAADPDQPGFKRVLLRPHPVADIAHVTATHESPYGRITSAWRREGNRFSWDVILPANTTGVVTLPPEFIGRTTESGHPVPATLTLGSGTYRFISE